MTTAFVHLHVHTEYSLVDGVLRVKPLVKSVARAGMPAVAVTDQGNLFAMVKFYKAALSAGIKPIVGADLWVSDPEAAEGRSRLVMLCRNGAGYKALTRLITLSYTKGQQQGVPVLERSWIEAEHEGLIVLSGGREGDVGRSLLTGDMESAARKAKYWCDLFPDAFYLELQRTGRSGDEELVHASVALGTAEDLPLVATNDVRFLNEDDFEAHEARVCIHDGRVLDDRRRPRHYSSQQYLRSPEEMATLFADLPEALENSVEIARRCNLDLILGKNFLPDFPVPEGLTIDEFLKREARAGLRSRFGTLVDSSGGDADAQCEVYEKRLERELDVIVQMGFPGYFLIVADFIRWARENDIPVGPGRGSGAGSLVAYALGITDLNPLRYDLLFERFLNPERVSMPDFDVDFCMEKRDRVIDYVATRYGREKVSQIATHGTMAAKAVVRDVGRVLGHPYGFVDRIAKLIPFEIGMTLEKALEQEEELRTLYETDEEVATLLDLARKLEGLARNVGKHAGGVVIAPTDLTDFAPLYCEPGGQGLATQYDKDDVEAVGLVKFDFLGLRTLTIIDWTVKAVNEMARESGGERLDIGRAALDDPKTFELLKRCATTAVFQLESRGMKDLIKRLQPDCFEDIVALVALFRPGPLQSGMVDDFIDRKHGRAKVEYPHPDLEPILKPTYGVILYQEQVMQIAQVLAGYTLGAADLLRRAMGKKKPEEMAKQREIFLAGSTQRGVNADLANSIFDLMEKFAGYGFNKSHSAAYALLSYQTAWLKHHYPAYFMAAVLSSDMDNTDKVVTLIEECRQMRLKVEPPNVNRSGWAFRARDDGTVVYGLGAVKGVGQSAIEALLEERGRGGVFTDVFDLCRRVDLKKLNRRVLEALIRSGSLDAIGFNRATLTTLLPEALQAAEQHARDAVTGQTDLFGTGAAPALAQVSAPPARTMPEWEESERLQSEKETLGLYLTGHPIGQYEAELTGMVTARLNNLVGTAPPDQSMVVRGRRNGGNKVTVAGLVVSMRARNTQSGNRMGFLVLDDRTGRMEVTVFPEAFTRYRSILMKDRVLVVEGTLDFDDFIEGYRVTAERVLDMDEAREACAKRLIVTVANRNGDTINALKETLSPFRDGRCPVWIDYRSSTARAMLRFGDGWRVRPSDELIKRLEAVVEPDTVRVEY